jgi:hypothetical protein
MQLTSYAEKLLSRQSARVAPAVSSSAGPARAGVAQAECPPAFASFPRLMKPSQVAAHLNVSAFTVLALRDSSDLVFINVGAPDALRPSWRITRASLVEFERKRRTAPKK